MFVCTHFFCVCGGGGGGGLDHGLRNLHRQVAQATEANHARDARRAHGLSAEVGQRRVGRDACAIIQISSQLVLLGREFPMQTSSVLTETVLRLQFGRYAGRLDGRKLKRYQKN
jgi:hypothetical protein